MNRFALHPAVALGILTGTIPALAATSNPFPSPIPKENSVVPVRNFAVIPRLDGATPRVQQMLADPGGRLFVVDQLGAIYLVSGDGKTVTRYLNFAGTPGTALLRSPEQGLASMAFHPDFLRAGRPGYGRFYTAHTTGNTTPTPDFTPGGGDDAGDHVVLEWRTADPPASTFSPATPAAPFRPLLRIEAPYGNHTIGLIAFNPNAAEGGPDYGKLYVAVGDGGSGGDPLNLAQNPNRVHGKILRLDPLGTNSANGRYGIPADNPFVGTGGGLPEIWALGLRNPQRFSWDRGGAKRMFIADIGQGTVEEINVGAPGANYGWRQREGSFVSGGFGSVGANARDDASSTGFTYPVAEYDHDEGSAVTAGFVARGDALPSLRGKFLFGDIVNGRVFTIDADHLPPGGSAGVRELRLRFGDRPRGLLEEIQQTQPGAFRVDLRFGGDRAGRIFLLNKQDGIVRVLGPMVRPRPAVTVEGKPVRSTAAKRFQLRGTARAPAGLKAVRVKLDARPFKNARGLSNWTFPVSVRSGRHTLVVRAVDQEGALSAPRRVIVIVR